MRDSQASFTAYSVAAHVMLLADDERFGHLIPAEAVEPISWFLEECKSGRLTLQRLHSSWFRLLSKLVEKWLLPGFTLHLALRKHWIEEQLQEALQNGIQQVVVVGAGFDPLAYRYHQKHPQVAFIEVDHPATQNVKRTALTKRTSLGENLHFVALDLKIDSLSDRLQQQAGFDQARPTFFIVEGLLMYLEEEAVKKNLRSMAQLGQQARMVGTALQPNSDGSLEIIRFKWFDPKRFHEPILWGIDRQELPQFFQEQAWQLEKVHRTKESLQTQFPELSSKELPEFEYLFSATSTYTTDD